MPIHPPPESLDEVPDLLARASFPHRLFADCRSALLLFCAGLYGRNDGYWAYQAALEDVTGVDVDHDRLEHMRRLYPASWRFVEADCFDFYPDRTWDLVVVDAPTLLTDRAGGQLEHWCGLANQAVVLGLHWEPLVLRSFAIPEMWMATELIKRAHHRGGTYWLVVERA